ncbi:MAG: hypothetical protein AAF497_13030 [Planctomycetota bacterium]
MFRIKQTRGLLVILVSITLANTSTAQIQVQVPGQVRQERRRDFIENLLRAVIESQVDSQNARQTQPGRQIVVPGQPRVVVQPRPNVTVSPQMVNLRRYVNSMGAECDNLIQDLRTHSATVPQVLPLLGDVIQIRANINVIQQQCNTYQSIEPIRPQVVRLDRDWRALKHHLGQLQLRPDCQQRITRCHTHHQELCGVYDLQPQFPRQQLAGLVNEMHADIQHLVQDIYYECRNHPQFTTLLQDGRTLQAKIERFTPLVRGGNYDQVVAAFKNCRTQWRRFSHQALQIASPRIRHDVCHIEDHIRQAADLLMLPVEFDREYTTDVCGWVDAEVNQILREITLADLLECDKPAQLIAAARQFRTRCNTFTKGIGRDNRPFDKLRLDYRELDSAWNTLNTQCRGLTNQDIIRRLDEIQYTMGVLQPTFGVAPVIPHWQLVNMSAELSQMANQIQLDVHRFDAGRYDNKTYRNLCRQCDDLHNAANKLHTMIVQKPRANFRPQMKKCFKQWTDVRDLLRKCPPQDRRQLAAYRGQIEPLMAKLQLVYAD